MFYLEEMYLFVEMSTFMLLLCPDGKHENKVCGQLDNVITSFSDALKITN